MASSAAMKSTSKKRAPTDNSSGPVKKQKFIRKIALSKEPLPNSAANRCFNIAELLEKILQSLDFTTLLLAQRTSKAFRNTVTGSLKLQKKLFQKPTESFEEVKSLQMLQKDSVILLAKLDLGDGIRAETQVLSVLNSVILDSRSYNALWNPSHEFPLSDVIERELRSPESNESSSWRTMYMSQPLPQDIRMHTFDDTVCGHAGFGGINHSHHSGNDVLPQMIQRALAEYPKAKVSDCSFEIHLDMLQFWGNCIGLEIKTWAEICDGDDAEAITQ